VSDGLADLRQKGTSSLAWNSASQAVQLAVTLVRSILLARALGPEPFGMYAYAQAIVAITSVFPEFGLGTAYLHRTVETEDEDALGVHFTLTVLFSFVWAILLLTALWSSSSEDTSWVFVVLVIAAFVTSLSKTAQLRLLRSVTHRRIAIVDLASTIATTPLALYLAHQGMGIWSLLVIDVVAAWINILGYYVFAPVWRPKLKWNKGIVSYYVRYGSKILSSNLLALLNDKLDDVWTGRYLGSIDLGFYSRAYGLANYPARIVTVPVTGVAGGMYAELKGDRARLSRAFSEINWAVIRASFLLSGLLFLAAPEFVGLVLGSQWLPVVPPVRLMLGYMMLDPLRYSMGGLPPMIGRPWVIARIQVVQLVVLVAMLYLLGPRLGVNGVALASTIMVVVGVVLILVRIRQSVDISVRGLFALPMAALVTGIVLSSIVALAAAPWTEELGSMLLKGLVFAGVYSALIGAVEKRRIRDAVTLVLRMSFDRRDQGKP